MGLPAALKRTFEGYAPRWEDLVVKVTDPRPCAQGGRHVVYTVTVQTRDGARQHAVVRRYTDFNEAFRVMEEKATKLYIRGCALPPIPPKEGFTLFHSAERREAFVHERRAGLEAFMNAVLRYPPLATASEFLGLLGLAGGGGYLGMVEVTRGEVEALCGEGSSGESEHGAGSSNSSSQGSAGPAAELVARLAQRADAFYFEARRGALVYRKRQTELTREARQVLPLDRGSVVPISVDGAPPVLLVDGPYLPGPVVLVAAADADAALWLQNVRDAISACPKVIRTGSVGPHGQGASPPML